jgi:hypothetical protein
LSERLQSGHPPAEDGILSALTNPAICRTLYRDASEGCVTIEWLPYQQFVGGINASKHGLRQIKKN